jgi:hypothetical protein
MQSYQLEPGTVAMYLFATRDDWQGTNGPNQMERPGGFMIRMQDFTPPTFSADYPSVLRTDFTAVRLAFELNEAGQIFYIVADSSRGLNVTVKDVFDLSVRPRYNAALAGSGIVNATAASVHIANVTGLKSLTQYTLWAAAVDPFGNKMVQPERLQFETLDDAPPILVASINEVGTGSAELLVKLDEPGFVYYMTQVLATQQTPCPEPGQLKMLLKPAPADNSTGTFTISEASLDHTRCSISNCCVPAHSSATYKY